MTTVRVPAAYVTVLRDAMESVRPADQVTIITPDDSTMGELVWEPDLSVAHQMVLNRLVSVRRSAVSISPAEWEALEPDFDGLRTYHGLATPTAAQTALATKAIIRVLRALLRD